MKFELPPLPYQKNALEPHMGRETLELHYEKHHRGYLEKLRKEIEGKPEAEKSLVEIIRSSEGYVFDNAAQVWNHTFFWESMAAKGGGDPTGEAARRIRDSFGSFDRFGEAFVSTGKSRFGSGYVWLVLDRDRLRCIETLNADTPVRGGGIPLLTCDVWEHAYYLDHRNQRGKYLETFLRHLVDWERVSARLEQAGRAAR
jgi:Fe-Mn family superoxide dismutase